MITVDRKPRYNKSKSPDFRELRRDAIHIVQNRKASKNLQIKLKAFLFPALYIFIYLILIEAGTIPYLFYSAYFLLGIFIVLNFLNLIHDAVHGVIFKNNPWLNRLYVYFFDILGANSYIWKIRHIRLHHAYPNIMNWDSDFEQSPLARVFPQAESFRVHKYQHVYLPLFYPLYLFNWLLVRDFKDFFKKDTLVHKVVKIPKIEYFKLFMFKAFFLFYTIMLPKLVLGVSWITVILGFVLMVFTASILSLLVLLSPHANINNEFPQPDEWGKMPYSWIEHQLRCTNDISNDNFFIRFFMGSFNYHIAHHLFPDIHHIHYPAITGKIMEFAHKNKLPYRKNSIADSLLSHYKLLKKNAYRENIFEETM